MKLLVFSIFDEKGGIFSNPFYMAHKGQAARAFSDVIQDKNTTISKHPEDYKLYTLGDWDDVSGQFTSLPQPEFMYHATDFLQP